MLSTGTVCGGSEGSEAVQKVVRAASRSLRPQLRNLYICKGSGFRSRP